eukprot:m.45281 g.45281  ORF g.45281 m.45281 type:complete len:260 (+) comp14649_c0_seq2:50-829(+)
MRLLLLILVVTVLAEPEATTSRGPERQTFKLKLNNASPAEGYFDLSIFSPYESQYNITYLSRDPPLLQLDDFLTDEECDLLQSLAEPNLAPSTGGLDRSVTLSRTSSTAWLNTELIEDPQHKAVLLSIEQKIAQMTGYPVENQEHFQVLRYEPGQYYRAHHDYLWEQANMPCGPRVATFFLYLNDVEEGGGTSFPQLNVTVWPKRRRAALWYNVYPKTNQQDHRTLHSADDVIKGIKWGANKWIHLYDFVTPWRVGQTG